MRSVYAEYYQEAIFWLSFRLLSIKDLMILLNRGETIRTFKGTKKLESGHYRNFIGWFKDSKAISKFCPNLVFFNDGYLIKAKMTTASLIEKFENLDKSQNSQATLK